MPTVKDSYLIVAASYYLPQFQPSSSRELLWKIIQDFYILHTLQDSEREFLERFVDNCSRRMTGPEDVTILYHIPYKLKYFKDKWYWSNGYTVFPYTTALNRLLEN